MEEAGHQSVSILSGLMDGLIVLIGAAVVALGNRGIGFFPASHGSAPALWCLTSQVYCDP